MIQDRWNENYCITR